jgi:hypothetical protein
LLLHLRLHRYLTRRGYGWLRRTGRNNWYIPAAALPNPGLDGRWQFIDKLYLRTPFRLLRMALSRRTKVPQFVDQRWRVPHHTESE